MNMSLSAVATVLLALSSMQLCSGAHETSPTEAAISTTRRQRAAPAVPAQVIRSVNPVAIERRQPQPQQQESDRMDLASLIRQQAGALASNKPQQQQQQQQHQQQHQQEQPQQRRSYKRDQVLSLLLQELPQLDIEVLNGRRQHIKTAPEVNNQQQQQQEQAGNLANMLQASRLHGRAAFSGPNQQQATDAAAPVNRQASELEGGLSAGYNPKRAATSNRHVPAPCGFFNAITCF